MAEKKDKKYIIDNAQLMSEWDWEKNDILKLDPSKLSIRSNKSAWWKCKKEHSWEAVIDKRTSGTNCPYCSNRRVLIGYNDLKTTAPGLLEEWDFERNTNISPLEITEGSSKKVWWKCSQCGYKWTTSIRDRTIRHGCCPQCISNQRVISRNKTLLKKNGCIINELLLKEWHYEKNGGLTPQDFTPSSNKAVWWKCSKCNYVWKAKISNRNIGRGCPCCSNKTVVKGINDLQTTNPDLAKEWHPTKNAPLTCDEVTIGYGKKVWWLCPNDHEYQATVLHRGHGTNCPICNSGRQTSFAEQAIYYYVKQLFPDAVNRCMNLFKNKMEVDIFIPSIKVAIEYDGLFWHSKDKSKQRENKKYQKCRENNIRLIRIREVNNKQQPSHTILTGNAAEYSDIKADYIFYIYENAKKNDFDKLIKNVLYHINPKCNLFFTPFSHLTESPINVDVARDEFKIRQYMKSLKDNSLAILHPELSKEWHPTKNGELTPNLFSSGSTYRAWWYCSVCGAEWIASIYHRVNGTGCPQCYLNHKQDTQYNCKQIYQYTLQGVFVKKWESISKAAHELKINSSNISTCAQHKRLKAGNYRWDYNYFEKLEIIAPTKKPRRESINAKPILQIDDTGNVITEFNSLNDASKILNINATSISKALNGHINKAGGFHWKFKNQN